MQIQNVCLTNALHISGLGCWHPRSNFFTQNTYFHLYQSLSCCFFFTVKNCNAEIVKPLNGHVHIESIRYQGIARYECNPGYKLVGRDVRTCQDNGHWSGTPPQCIGKIFWPLTILLTYVSYLTFYGCTITGRYAYWACRRLARYGHQYNCRNSFVVQPPNYYDNI